MVGVHLSEMNILSWNVNGLTSREKNGQLKWFYYEKPDILCLQETKLTSKNTEEFSEDFSGYYKYNTFERNGSGTSGVSIFTKNKPLNVERSFNGKYEGHGRILKADYENFTLLNVYFPHEGALDCNHYDFYDTFLEYAVDLTQDKDVLICGDFNIAHKEEDLENPEKDEMGFKKEQRDKLNKLTNNGYLDTFRMFNEEPENYTWWGNGFRTRERCRGWRIDYFFASESLKHRIELGYIRSDIIGSKDLPGSDHCPIGVKMKI